MLIQFSFSFYVGKVYRYAETEIKQFVGVTKNDIV